MSGAHHDVDGLVDALVKKLAETQVFTCPVEPERRAQDHEWVLLKRQKEIERIQFWKELRLHLAKWGAIGVAAFLLAALWKEFALQVSKSAH